MRECATEWNRHKPGEPWPAWAWAGSPAGGGSTARVNARATRWTEQLTISTRSCGPPCWSSRARAEKGEAPSASPLPHRIDSSGFPLTPALSLQGRGSKTAAPAPRPLRSPVPALPGGVARERRGGCSVAQRLPPGWSEQIPSHVHHTLAQGEACPESRRRARERRGISGGSEGVRRGGFQTRPCR